MLSPAAPFRVVRREGRWAVVDALDEVVLWHDWINAAIEHRDALNAHLAAA